MRQAGALIATLLCLLVALPAAAEASITLRSTQRDFDTGTIPPGTLVIDVAGSAGLRLEHSGTAGTNYTLTATSGGPIMIDPPSSGEDIQEACSGNATNVVTCPDTEVFGIGEPVEAPYRIRVNETGGTLVFGLNAPSNTQDANVVFPTADIKVVAGASSPTNIDNDTGTPLTVLGGSADDTFHPGAGNDTFVGNALTDTVIYDNTFGIAGRCAVVSLDGVANDTMHAGGCATGSPGPTTETDNISSADVVTGTGNADSITGSNAAETLNGSGGDDRLLGAAGSDSLHGGAGNDLLDGGGSADDLHADADGATMTGGAGSDLFFGSPSGGGTVSYADKSAPVSATLDASANDGLVDDGIAPGNQSEADNIDDNVITVIGGSNNDTLSAVSAPSARSLAGGPGNDTITGGPGNDGLVGDNGDDTLTDGSATSDDVFLPGPGDDTYSDSGDSNNASPTIGDRLDYSTDSAGVSLSVSGTNDDGEPGSTETVGSDFEILAGGSGNDTITSGNAAQALFGLTGNDVLSGLGGNDVLNGGDGTAASGCDTLQPGTGDDLVDEDLGCRDLVDYSVGHPGAVQITLGDTGGATQDIDPTAGVENETFTSTTFDVRGSPAADTLNFSSSTSPHKLFGGPGTIVDTITGGSANDTLIGEPGNDQLNGGSGSGDVSSYEDRSANIVATIGAGPDGDPLLSEADAFTSIEGLTGGGGTDQLTGDGAANPLSGGGANDTLIGGLGNDPLDGGSGTDTSSYQDRSADIVATLGAGADGDPLLSEADAFTSIEGLTGGSGQDKLAGNSGVNPLNGGLANDTLIGGTGNDPLDGGGGTGDVASYEDRSAGIIADLGSPTDDGDPLLGEEDQFTNIEGLTGGDGPDQLTGDIGANQLSGGPANDTLIGGTGNDPLDGGGGTDVSSYQDRSADIVASLGPATGPDGDPLLSEADVFTSIEGLTGGNGADQLTGDTGANPLSGRGGADDLQGLNGPDSLTGGDGTDTLGGGEGDDGINSRDAFADAVTCGIGNDSVTSDTLDTVGADCELVDDGVPDPLPPAGGGAGPAGAGPGGDVVKPALAGLGTSPGTFAAAAKGGSVVSKAKVGTKVSYSLSEAATVTFTVERSKAGRKVKGKCRKRSRANRKRGKCDLLLKGSFKHAGKAGRNSFRFSGRLRGRKLSRGRYNLVASARDAAGNVSKGKRTRFRIVRR